MNLLPDRSFFLKFGRFRGKLVQDSSLGIIVGGLIYCLGLYLDLIGIFVSYCIKLNHFK